MCDSDHNNKKLKVYKPSIGQFSRKDLPLGLKHVSPWIDQLHSVVRAWIMRRCDHNTNRGCKNQTLLIPRLSKFLYIGNLAIIPQCKG